jgi:TolB protein
MPAGTSLAQAIHRRGDKPMNFRMKQLISLMALCLWGFPLAGQGPIELGDVVGSATVDKRSVRITGSPAVLVNQASRLVDLHGGLERSGEEADFILEFTGGEGPRVGLEILSGGRTLWESEYTGSTRLKALYAAADEAVLKILGLPGWFGSELAFISDRSGHAEVYTADILFETVRQLTQDRSQCLSPDLSPDLRSLLYTSYHRTGFPDIYRIDLRTGQRTVFAGFKGTNTGATYSPDGRQVAMILSGSGNSEVFVSNAEGSQLRRLTRSASLEADPTWSPDGRRLAFTSDRLGGPQIYVMDAQGRSVSRVRTDISRNCSEPDWNPRDSSQIAFTAAVAGEFETAVYSFSEGRSRIVTRGAGDAVHPVWLRDGRHLVYTERTPRHNRLMVLDTVTGSISRLSPANLNDSREASVIYPAR